MLYWNRKMHGATVNRDRQSAQFGLLTHIELQETGSAETSTWVLADESGRKASFEVGPEMLALILQLTCALVDRSAKASRPVPAPGAGGLSTGLPAQSIEVTPGRTPKEVALHVHLGKVDVAYLVPLDSVVIALGTLMSGLYPDPEGPAH